MYDVYACMCTCIYRYRRRGEERERERERERWSRRYHSQHDYTPGTITVHNDPGGTPRAPPPPANTPRSSTNPAAFHDHEYRERVERATPPHILRETLNDGNVRGGKSVPPSTAAAAVAAAVVVKSKTNHFSRSDRGTD